MRTGSEFERDQRLARASFSLKKPNEKTFVQHGQDKAVNWWTVLWYIFFGWTEREPKAKVLADSSEDCNNKALHNRLIMSTNSADVDDPNEVLQNIHRTRSFSTVNFDHEGRRLLAQRLNLKSIKNKNKMN